MMHGSIVHLIFASIRASAPSFRAWFVTGFMMACNNLIFFTMWLALFRQARPIGGWTLPQTMLLYGFGALSFGIVCCLAGGFRNLPELVESGRLSALLLRPRSPLLLVLTSRSDASGWGDILSGLVLIAWSGMFSTPADWALLIPVIVLASVVFLSASLIFYSLAFWLEKSDTVAARLWELFITLSLYPDGIYPVLVKLIVYTAIPAAFAAFVPLEVLQHHSLSAFLMLFAATLFWGALSYLIFTRGVRRYMHG
jgi:ABC-2 type transport system permease protein